MSGDLTTIKAQNLHEKNNRLAREVVQAMTRDERHADCNDDPHAVLGA